MSQESKLARWGVTAYVGFPNFSKRLLHSLDVIPNGSVSGINPMGLRLDYQKGENWSFGADIIYNGWSVVGYKDSIDVNGRTVRYHASANMRRIRAHFRANYYFSTSNQLDFYTGFGFGLNYRHIGISGSIPGTSIGFVGQILPFSARVCMGANVRINKHFGANAEMGLGGPLFSLGLRYQL